MVRESNAEHPWLTFAAVSSGVLLSTVDGSIVNVALPTLSEEFGEPLAVVQWVVLAYLLTQSTLVLMVGRLGDMIGKKRIFTIGFVVFTLFSAIAAAAPTVFWLIAARALQAIGGAMVIGLGIAILTEAFPDDRRGQVLGLIGAVVSVGIVTGPTLGGLILDVSSWPWIFLVNVPIGLIATGMAIRYVPDTRPAGRQRFDAAGSSIFLVAMLSLLLALSFGQERGFSEPLILSLLGLAILTTIAFVALELTIRDPMLDLTMFSHVDFSIGVVTGMLTFMAVGGLFIVSPFYLTDTLGLSPRDVGLVVAAGPLMIGLTSPISGRVSDRIGSRPVTVVGLAIVLVGYVLLLRLDGQSGVPDVLVALIPIGAGLGVFQSPNNSAVMGSVPPSRFGVAGSMLTLVRIVGQTIGIAALGAVWAIRLAARLAAQPATEPSAVAEAGAVRDFSTVGAALLAIALVLAVWAFRRDRADRVSAA